MLREIHPIPSVDEILAQFAGAKYFSKLDANSGFWQIPLSKKSQPLTTFVTPFGRYCFNKLPFGICSAPGVYQRNMNQILEGLPGVVCLIDDILIFGQHKKEHDRRLHDTLKRLQQAKVTLNPKKCHLNQQSIKFLGHLIDSQGIQAGPEKTSAIENMETPKSITDLHRFVGMVNQLGKFSPNIADLAQPLRACLSTRNAWTWGPTQEKAFSKVKQELVGTPTLALYDPKLRTKIMADASSFGLGAVLMQEHHKEWRPVAYASRAMSNTERHYAQIEKEALAIITWACEKFRTYVMGLTFLVETDHKLLVPLLSTKHLELLPPRLIRFRLRLGHFSYTIEHIPGKLLYTADVLSRASESASPDSVINDMEVFVASSVVAGVPASSKRLEIYSEAQKQDGICKQIRKLCSTSWPTKERTPLELKPYWTVKPSFSMGDDLLMFNCRIVVPKSLQKETLEKIHQGHQGIERCLLRMKNSAWWPGITSRLNELIQNCKTCCQNTRTSPDFAIARIPMANGSN